MLNCLINLCLCSMKVFKTLKTIIYIFCTLEKIKNSLIQRQNLTLQKHLLSRFQLLHFQSTLNTIRKRFYTTPKLLIIIKTLIHRIHTFQNTKMTYLMHLINIYLYLLNDILLTRFIILYLNFLRFTHQIIKHRGKCLW